MSPTLISVLILFCFSRLMLVPSVFRATDATHHGGLCVIHKTKHSVNIIHLMQTFVVNVSFSMCNRESQQIVFLGKLKIELGQHELRQTFTFTFHCDVKHVSHLSITLTTCQGVIGVLGPTPADSALVPRLSQGCIYPSQVVS